MNCTEALAQRLVRVSIGLRGAVEYVAEVEMPEHEYETFLQRIESGDRRVADDLVQRFDIDLADPSAWGDVEVDQFDAPSVDD